MACFVFLSPLPTPKKGMAAFLDDLNTSLDLATGLEGQIALLS